MPNHKSAEKRVRQSERRRLINRANRTKLRTSMKRLRGALSDGNVNETKSLLPTTISEIDKAVQKGAMHRNAASRHKSRLTIKINQLSAK